MKKFAATLALIGMLGQATPAMAWIGGPYSNNTYDGIDGGVFNFTGRFKNGSCIGRFAQTALPEISPNSESIFFYRGRVYIGDVMGLVDFQTKKVFITTQGVTNTGAGVGGVGIATSTSNGKLVNVRPGIKFKCKGFAYFYDSTATVTNTVTNTTTNSVDTTREDTIPGSTDPVTGVITGPTTITYTNNVTNTVTNTTNTDNFMENVKTVKLRITGTRSALFYTPPTEDTPTPPL